MGADGSYDRVRRKPWLARIYLVDPLPRARRLQIGSNGHWPATNDLELAPRESISSFQLTFSSLSGEIAIVRCQRSEYWVSTPISAISVLPVCSCLLLLVSRLSAT